LRKSESILDHYEFGEIIGDPSWNKARLAIHKLSGIERAVKIIEKFHLANIAEFQKKFDILKSLNHPNISKIVEIFEDDKNFYLVNEIMKGGDICEVLDRKGSFSE
jgi:calcium-dependent protein kinase